MVTKWSLAPTGENYNLLIDNPELEKLRNEIKSKNNTDEKINGTPNSTGSHKNNK